MDAFGFFSSIVGSLAWPLAVVAIAILFQAQWRDLIDRISRAKAGPVEVWADFRDKVVHEVTSVAPGAASGVAGALDPVVIASDADGVRIGGTPSAIASALENKQITIDAVIGSMKQAATPKELADRVIDYVNIRTVPGLRGLSNSRIALEAQLFGSILTLQSLRSQGKTVSDSRKLADALTKIEVFWGRPELLSDEEVANLTALVRAVCQDMTKFDKPA
jgi:hypothetical protein